MKPKISPHPELIKNLPEEVKTLFQIFGDEIRLIGGSVRDLLLEKKVNDFDFATKFLPEEIIKILTKNKIQAIPTGIKFGTITAVVNKKNFEITTLRKDNETDGRHCSPEFVDDYFLDAARRDFTINALYLDSAGSLYDYFDGISDLKNHQVKFIGDANCRIAEDFLRILRFFRFSCQYAEKLDATGLEACVKQKENLPKLSKERIRAEVLKMLSSDKKQNLVAILRVLKSAKIADEIFVEKLDIEALEHLFEIEKKLEITSDLNLKLATLFLQKDFDLKVFAKEISATNLEKKYLQFLSLHRDGLYPNNLKIPNFSKVFFRKNRDGECKPYQVVQRHSPSEFLQKRRRKSSVSSGCLGIDLQALKQLLASTEKNLIQDLYLLTFAKNFDPKKLPEAQKIIQFLQEFSLPHFPLNGEDVMQLGFSGKAVGEAINRAKKFWSENDFKTNKTALINFLKTN